MNELIAKDAEEIAISNIEWDKLKNKVVLIAGANGYVPQFFVHALLKRNDLFNDNITVIAMCRNKKKADSRFSNYYDRKDFRLIIQDVCVPLNYIDNIDFIINAACPAGLKSRYENVISLFETNIEGCKNLLELAKEKNARYMYISSIDVYGKNENIERLNEQNYGVLDSMNVRNVYACSKKAAENLCACYSYCGVENIVVRPSQILGGGIELDDGRLHIDFISQIINDDKIVLKGDGSPKRSFIYVTDAIVAMLTALIGGNSGEAYNVCNENGEATVLELAEIMSSLVKDREVSISYNMETRKTDPSVTQVVSVVCGDATKIHNLGWAPKVSLTEACKRMMAYYGLTVDKE